MPQHRLVPRRFGRRVHIMLNQNYPFGTNNGRENDSGITPNRFMGASTGARRELFGKVGTRKAEVWIIAESS